MNAPTTPSRRTFLKASATLGAGLVVAFVVPGAKRFAMAAPEARPRLPPALRRMPTCASAATTA